MNEQKVISCPECGEIMKVGFPSSFLLNVVQVDCPGCRFRDREDGYSRSEALEELMKRLNAITKAL